jgi:hypothetical protein
MRYRLPSGLRKPFEDSFTSFGARAFDNLISCLDRPLWLPRGSQFVTYW